jgi:SpoIIAA-like
MVIERIEDMPEGTIGFRATGHVTREDYRDVLEPAMREAVDSGEVRMLYAVGPGFEKFEAGALAEDTKTGIGLGIEHHSAWKRTAVLTDVDWVRHAIGMFGWMAPGEVMVGGLDELDAAKAWLTS